MKAMLKYSSMALACSLAMALPAHAFQTLDGSEKELGDEVLKTFMIGLANDVRDPLAAQFHSLAPSPSNMAGKYICGFGNFKNGMGGYGGFKPFWHNTRDKKTFIFESYDQPDDLAYDFDMMRFKVSGCEFVLDLRD